jgi:protein-L-isoaspartate(D-aspartate) O-methyltransferase
MTEALGLGPDDPRARDRHRLGLRGGRCSPSARARVDTIERHEGLAASARARLAELGYANVRVRVGDGTLGWPEAAPFDAIVATAGGPTVPRALLAQLAVGGRLVMPVGAMKNAQTLVRVVRTFDDRFEEDDLGGVAFVPLIGAQGWEA